MEDRQIGSLVPVDPKQEPELVVDVELTKFLNDLKDRCAKLNSAEWLNIKRQMVRARNYFDGRQYGTVNEACQWVDYERRPGEISYTVETYQAHIQTALTEISKGSTSLSFSHVAPDSRHGQMIAQIAETLYKTFRRKLFTVPKQQQENLSLLLNGVASRYTYFCEQSDRTEKVPMMGESDVQGDSIKACAECGYPIESGECPGCGSTEVTEISAPGYKAKAVVGYGDVASGENDYDVPDPLGLTWYLYAEHITKTPFVGWKQVILKDVLETKYKGSKIMGGINSPELNYQAGLKSSTPASIEGTQGSTDMAELEQWWFEPSLYAKFTVGKDTKLRNGSAIPAGTKLGQVFPKGLYVAYNSSNILDIWPENKNDKWTIAPYVTRMGTMVGAGTSAALATQDQLNDLRNLQMASILNDAFAKEFVDAQYIDAENIPNDPSERAVVNNIPPGQRIIGTAIDRLPPSPLSSDAYAMTETLSGEMQMVLGTFSGTQTGMPDLKAVQDTASGMQMWREMTVGRFYPMLAIRADQLDREQALQLLKNCQKYYSPEQWEKYKGDYDKEPLQAFLKANLDEELIVEVANESFMPISTSQQQANALGYAKYFVETKGSMGDEMNAHVAKLFHIPTEIIGNEATQTAAYTAVQAFKDQSDSVVETYGDLPSFDINDPQIMQMAQLVVEEADMPISFEMDDLSTYADTLRDWYNKDDGRHATNLLKSAVHFRMMEIDQAALKKQQKELTLQMAAQAPAMQAQAQQQAQQQQAEAEAQNAGQADQREHEKEMSDREMAGKQMDANNQLNQSQIQSQESQAQRDHDAMMKQQEAQMANDQHQREMEKMNSQDMVKS
jgi:hypothetical protein